MVVKFYVVRLINDDVKQSDIGLRWMMVRKDNRTTIRLPPILQEKLEKEVAARGITWEDRSKIVIEALSDHYMENDPEEFKDQIFQTLQEGLQHLKDEVAIQVHEQVQSQLRQILGEKFRS